MIFTSTGLSPDIVRKRIPIRFLNKQVNEIM